MKSKELAIVGAGIIGIATAFQLLKQGWKVRIIARAQTPDTTSDVAAGFWFPFKVGNSKAIERWAVESKAIWLAMIAEGIPGVSVAPLWILERPASERLPLPSGIGGAQELLTDVLPAGFSHGRQLEVPLINTRLFFPWLTREVIRLGAMVETRQVSNLHVLAEQCGLVVNCSGLGARTLAGDRGVFPIRGQILRVKRPRGLRNTILLHEGSDEVTYVVPRSTDCILGGTAEQDQDGMIPNPDTAQSIRERCCALDTSLREAEVLEDKVGLRPGRSEVRLEKEVSPGGAVIVHNYGHGGAGYTLCWGCANEVANLVAQPVVP